MQALPLSARLYITSLLGNRNRGSQTQVSDLSLLSGGFLGRNFTFYLEQHVIDSGTIGATEQSWLSWNGLFGGTNSLQAGKFHTPFPFMPAHAWTMSDYLLADQTSGQNAFNSTDARWGAAFSGMSNEFMYNLSWLTGAGPIQDALDYNKRINPRALDVNVSYGGMLVPWSIGIVGIRGNSPVHDPATKRYLSSNGFTREGVYLGYQTAAWHYQTMYYHGSDSNPGPGEFNVPLNGFFLEAERDLGWENHLALRYDVASSDTLDRQLVLDLSHNMLPNLALVGEAAVYPGSAPQFGLRVAYAGPYASGKRVLSNFTAVSASEPAAPANGAIGDANGGAKLVQANGCEGCHGAGLKGGGIGPQLYGIERKLTPHQIANFIRHPHAPMPNFGFSERQIADIVAYLSNLDGGATDQAPVVTFSPAKPTDVATITVRFPGAPPDKVTVTPIMRMGSAAMPARAVPLMQSKEDPHVFTGQMVFSMGGPWTIAVQYGGKTMNVPLDVGQ